MDGLRNMISNLYIYNGDSDNSTLPLITNNNETSNNIPEEIINENDISNNNISSELHHNHSNSDVNMSHSGYKYCEYCKDRNLNYSNEKKEIKKSFKPSINYYSNSYTYNNNDSIYKRKDFIRRNKDLIKEKEYQIKEEKLRKENEALQLLLKNSQQLKNNRNNNVISRLYDYEKYQKVNPKFKLNESRAQSSRIYLNKKNIIKDIIKKNPSLGYYNDLILKQNLKLPKIYKDPFFIKENFTNLNLHKNFGRIPEYLLRLKEETRLQKEKEKFLENEKYLPKGTRILPEEEKKERIEELSKMKRELEEELFQLPIARLSLRQIERKGEIQKSLNDIDVELNRLISYKVVVVKI